MPPLIDPGELTLSLVLLALGLSVAICLTVSHVLYRQRTAGWRQTMRSVRAVERQARKGAR